MWQQLKIAPEVESDLRDTVDWGRRRLADLNSGKIQLVLYDRSIKTGAIHVKMDGYILEKKKSLKLLELAFFLNWIGAHKQFLLLKLPPRKLEP